MTNARISEVDDTILVEWGLDGGHLSDAIPGHCGHAYQRRNI